MARRRRGRGGRKPLPKAVWSKLARKVGPAKASAMARSNPSKARKMAGGRGGYSRGRRRGTRGGGGVGAAIKAVARKVADAMPL
jgi:hypothetical protein